MSNAQPSRYATAFQSGAATQRTMTQAVPAPTGKEAPSPRRAPRPRKSVQTQWIPIMLCLAMAFVVTGLIYLSGHARKTEEGYRRVRLQKALRQEREKSLQWNQLLATAKMPATIDRKAADMGMVRAAEKDTVTIQK